MAQNKKGMQYAIKSLPLIKNNDIVNTTATTDRISNHVPDFNDFDLYK
ncbi:hypothetical protein VEE71_40760 [Escherichia coli]|nr:hypothetical protein VEGS02_40940 [Escherichia coli]BDD19339.1 hypothetical protein VEGS17_A13480 [Escherichia coli]BED15353.1 hypothetical protein VEE71_40760 [Escherichia coli]